MRKVLLFMMVSVDGYFEDAEGTIDWHNVDEDFNEFAIEQLDGVDTLLFGRVTYELMASYWPTEGAIADDPEVAGRMNAKPKIVFSNSLEGADWEHTTLISGDAATELARLKQEPGGDMIIMGSSRLAASLGAAGLIDEYRIIVAPIALGDGRPVLGGMTERVPLQLAGARTFDSGNVLLTYRPAEPSR
jgi:dihydrofolate reductase